MFCWTYFFLSFAVSQSPITLHVGSRNVQGKLQLSLPSPAHLGSNVTFSAKSFLVALLKVAPLPTLGDSLIHFLFYFSPEHVSPSVKISILPLLFIVLLPQLGYKLTKDRNFSLFCSLLYFQHLQSFQHIAGSC